MNGEDMEGGTSGLFQNTVPEETRVNHDITADYDLNPASSENKCNDTATPTCSICFCGCINVYLVTSYQLHVSCTVE